MDSECFSKKSVKLFIAIGQFGVAEFVVKNIARIFPEYSFAHHPVSGGTAEKNQRLCAKGVSVKLHLHRLEPTVDANDKSLIDFAAVPHLAKQVEKRACGQPEMHAQFPKNLGRHFCFNVGSGISKKLFDFGVGDKR